MSNRLAFPKDKQGFLLLSYPRSGSHFLRSLLNEHPDIKCHGEIFNRELYPEPGHVEQRLIQYWKGPLTGMIAHAYIGWRGERDCVWRAKSGFAGLFPTLPLDTKIVCIQRWNLFRRHVSHLLAQASNEWTVMTGSDNAEARAEAARTQTIRVDVVKLRLDVDVTRAILATLGLQFVNTHLVTYEQLRANTEEHIRRIYEHLGADPDACKHVKAKTMVLNADRPIREIVTNYGKVKKHFAGTDLACYFDE